MDFITNNDNGYVFDRYSFGVTIVIQHNHKPTVQCSFIQETDLLGSSFRPWYPDKKPLCNPSFIHIDSAVTARLKLKQTKSLANFRIYNIIIYSAV